MKKLTIIILSMVVVCSAQLSPDKQRLYYENKLNPVTSSIMSMILPTSGYFYSQADDKTNMLFYTLFRAGSAYLFIKSINHKESNNDLNNIDMAPLLAIAGAGLYFLFGFYEAKDVYNETEQSNLRLYRNIESFNKVSFNFIPYKNGAKFEAVIPLNDPNKK